VADYDKVIPPGGEGKVTLKIDTGGYRGEVTKNTRVHTNDPKNPVSTLTIKAFVKVPIFVSTRYVRLEGLAGDKVTGTVDIKAQKERPLALEPAGFNLDAKATYRIEEITPGKEYKVHFTNISDSAGTYLGFLRLKTNYPEKPEISIRVRGRFRPEGQ
jgi:hypothetical protein